MQVHVLPVAWDEYREKLESIRAAVFIEEQGVDEAIERDGQDDSAQHFLALTEAGQAVGCARLLPSGQIGRIAVLPQERGKKVGFQLLQLAVEQGRTLGLDRLFLNAQAQAENFYRRAGFVSVGAPFNEAGRPHQRMELMLPIPFEKPDAVPKPVIREEPVDPDAAAAQLITHRGESECLAGILAVLDHPLRHVRIYSQLLDHTLFDRAEVAQALSSFVRAGPPANLKILIDTSNLVVSRGHRLLDLARRLASKIEIRVVPPDLQEARQSYVLADERAYFLLPDYQEYQAFSNQYDPVQSQQLAEGFDYRWQRGIRDPELRALSL